MCISGRVSGLMLVVGKLFVVCLLVLLGGFFVSVISCGVAATIG